ncbi:MAG: hypothetical protein K2N34_11910, partial [Lachnospiraceae bacterium]|nr:hypothetical protein [Lachnospiraceae bacterium]
MMEFNDTVLDLCEMSDDNTKLLNKIFDIYSSEYTNFVDELSDIWGQKWYWWVTNFSSRNIFLSNAYKDICIVLVAIDNMQKNKDVDRIIVPNENIAKTLKQYVKSKQYKTEILVKT